ncbi:GPW/gp25 family protein [Tenacibaculum jejuense]|uniref:Phage baseplate assembly protein W n=1 Tax=Tenacibaculum jejuense TaxID=584609 RepID=A0A238UD31_9FLAO|nr:GPW/gp25 family protein [Tenacibaculum jejuense]SNR16926.1 Phage baseplate assembly protein W [Tenacibaculum jejuense]
MSNENKFLGTGWSFPPEFFDGGATVALVSGEEDIKQSLQIILSTSLKERVMHSDYGCNLRDLLFEHVTAGLISDMKNTISNAILNHEPRIEVENISVELRDATNGILDIHINYKVRMTNNRFNYVFPFYINEVFN